MGRLAGVAVFTLACAHAPPGPSPPPLPSLPSPRTPATRALVPGTQSQSRRLHRSRADDAGDLGQAGWFRDVCRLYLRSAEVKRRYAEVAESDVADALLHYLGQENWGRKLVLLGHSQGAEMVVFLLRRFFDDDPVLQQRLLRAMPIGWPIEVSQAKTVGGTFAHLAVCTRRGETGCIVSYRPYVAGSKAAPPSGMMPSPGHQSVCVNPAELLHGAPRPFSRALVPAPERPLTRLDSDDGEMTPLVMLRDFYRGECVDVPAGYRYLAISEAHAPGDVRVSPIDLSAGLFHSPLGLHLLDYQFALGDLLDLVSERAAALPPG